MLDLQLQIMRSVERHNRRNARVLFGPRANPRYKMPASRFTDQRDAADIDLVVLRVSLHPTDGSLDIFGARRPTMLRSQPIVDREPRKSRFDAMMQMTKINIAVIAAARRG